MATSKPHFRVVIVGGSIAGLTLAHCLARNHIDFVVLESHSDIAPQVGASIGMLPNGARILDQIGVYDDVLDVVEPLTRAFTWTDAGKPITETDAPLTSHRRHGYPTAFLDRQILLGILYDHLGQHQEHILLNKKVTHVEHLADKVVVHCADQSTFEGDVVVGADGVRSIVRQQMWSYMESQGLRHEAQTERNRMTSEYNCVFGISTATPGLTPGHIHRTFAEGYSLLTIIGKEGRVFWFFFTRMSQKFPADRIPRYSPDDIDRHMAPYLHKPITADVPFAEIQKRAIVRTLVPLEEANYEHWGIDRYVCIGDSAHKMTPNLGQGGNSAIESAASLANTLSQLLRDSPGDTISAHDIHRRVQAWQTPRQRRMEGIWQSAHELTRIEALAGLKQKLVGLYLLPHISGYLLDKMSATIVGAAKLDCEPLPPKSLQCSMPYVDEESSAGAEPLWRRVLSTTPLLACYAAAHTSMGTIITHLRPLMIPYFAQGTWTATTGEVLDLYRPLYGVRFLDTLFRPLITCFLPSISGSDPASRIQMMSFMADLGPVYAIWLLESDRHCRSWKDMLLPIATGIAFQLNGIGKWAPIYYALEHLCSPSPTLHPDGPDQQIPRAASTSLLLALLAGYYLPTAGNFLSATVESRRGHNAAWQLFPVVVPLLQVPLRRLVNRLWPSSTEPRSARETKKRDMRYVRCAYGALALVSGATFVRARWTAPAGVAFSSIFWPGWSAYREPVTSFAAGIARFLQYDEVVSMASGFVWLGLKFAQLKRDGADVAWWKLVGGLVGTTCALGPGAAFALGWGWREEILARGL